jgi:hypothetical protein
MPRIVSDRAEKTDEVVVLPGILWVSTMLIALSSFTFEFAR